MSVDGDTATLRVMLEISIAVPPTLAPTSETGSLLAEEPFVLKARQVASILGIDVRNVYRPLETGQLHGVKVNSSWRIARSALESFLAGER